MKWSREIANRYESKHHVSIEEVFTRISGEDVIKCIMAKSSNLDKGREVVTEMAVTINIKVLESVNQGKLYKCMHEEINKREQRLRDLWEGKKEEHGE